MLDKPAIIDSLCLQYMFLNLPDYIIVF